ncbi:MAG: hypothetical protein R3358_06535 [Woeseiaceae bacterium]|nr:hypothetical protein [Woeseiaceae bacterium]
MDTTWIQVIVLTLSECVAPAGKTVCQEREFELQFLTMDDCQAALEQLVSLKNAADNVIVNTDRSGCAPSARKVPSYASRAAINQALGGMPGYRPPTAEDGEPDMITMSHAERLERVKSCEETGGVAPCRMGDIILEGADIRSVEVWRRDQ